MLTMQTTSNLGTLLDNFGTFTKALQFIPEIIPSRDMNTRRRTATEVDQQDSRCHGENYRVSVAE